MGVDETGRKMWDAYGDGWETVGTGTAKITQSTKHLTTKKKPQPCQIPGICRKNIQLLLFAKIGSGGEKMSY